MAVKGASSKKVIIDKILDTFEGSFLCNNGKELRIALMEDGEPVEIKVALTCAKVNVGGVPQQKPLTIEEKKIKEQESIQPSEKELERVKKLLDSLNF